MVLNMPAFNKNISFVFTLFTLFLNGYTQHVEVSCSPDTISTVQMTDYCTKKVMLENDTSILLVPSIHTYHILPKCINCTVVIETAPDEQVLAALFKLGTETGQDETCDLIRLDIYDGSQVDEHNFISGKQGICGYTFPEKHDFKSTNNTLTLHLMTSCDQRQYGEMEIVISAVKNDAYNLPDCKGRFECDNGQCIDKNLVCNGKPDCKDSSDEKNCHKKNDTCSGMFRCIDGACVDKNDVCNGKKDCPDGSDECKCQAHFRCPGEFECSNGHCVGKNDVCNGKNDCGDNSDETDCEGVSRTLLYCLFGLAGVIFILLVVVIVILCWRFCYVSGKVASVYRRLT
ncbi:hypothetical protein ACF0H5_006614 [Mactra antiquata]